MPPKKVKDLANAPVLKMAHEEQVQLLSDALLREYMHRRGFLATLKAFDEEHPRDANTISSRALMSDLMALNPDDQQRMKGEGIETIMEMLCNLRVERRLETEKLIAEANTPLPQVPADYEVLKSKQTARAARKAERKQHKASSKKTSKSSTSTTKGRELEGTWDSLERSRSGCGKHRQHLSVTPSSSALPGKESVGMTMDDLLDSSRGSNDDRDEHGIPDEKKGCGGGTDRHTVEEAGARSAPQLSVSHAGLPSSRIASEPVAQPAWVEVAEKQKSLSMKGSGGGEGVQQRSSDDEGDDGDEASKSEADEDSDNDFDGLGGAVLTEEQREELCAAFQLLCGFEGSLHKDFLEQGFTFDNCADCALVQWKRGGCDGVIAPIQAFVAAYYYEREVYVNQEQRVRECLAKALCTSLEQAQMNAAKIVLLDIAWDTECGSSCYTRSQVLKQAGKPCTRCWANMMSMQEVTAVVREKLLTEKRWMKPRGGGILSFLFSLLISRGVDVVQQELINASTADSGRPSLLVPVSCRATLGLVNLVLTGRTVFFHHNGVRNGNQTGYCSRLRCGLLCGDSTADLDDHNQATAGSVTSSSSPSYTNAMEPQFPSWVLWHHESFSNLYMTKETRQLFQQKLNLGGNASMNLVYWDSATSDDEFPLTVTVRSIVLGTRSGGGHGARNAKSFVNTAITSVPSWSSAVIDWNGKTPVRETN
ncbi:hypothetical protein, conserved [Leishmania tarentolae]|uniref:Probable ubiquitin carboxyl-terminal hydrolase MINDY-4 n=1 Tax=Leishmania tarentolae TaxID=5689 RepID=A0A640KSJ0_LEITA|nr:hypothetical protein, conserved [Leishmania tarentolae]